MKKIAVYEYAKLIGVTPKTVYKMIEKEEVITTKEIVNNREVKRIVVDDEEILRKYTNLAGVSKVNIQNELDIPKDDCSSINSFSGVNDEKLKQINLLENNSDMYKSNDLVNFMREMAGYIELSGQAKLLTDSEYQTKQEYFKVVQENKQLLQEKTIVETENRLINKQLEELKQKLDNAEKKETNNWWSKL